MFSGNPFSAMDYCISSVCRGRIDFRKADLQGENPFAKGFSPWAPFPKTPKWLRRSLGSATGSLARTRAKKAYLGVVCCGGWGGFKANKSCPDCLRSKRDNPFCQERVPGPFSKTLTEWLIIPRGPNFSRRLISECDAGSQLPLVRRDCSN
jgi:hypothetical protein